MPAIKLHPQRILKRHGGYTIIDERSFDAKGVITKTNICVYKGKSKKLKDKFKNIDAALAYIMSLL